MILVCCYLYRGYVTIGWVIMATMDKQQYFFFQVGSGMIVAFKATVLILRGHLV